MSIPANRCSVAAVALVIAFSVVITIIADLDRTRAGLLQVSQQAMRDAQEHMRAPSR